METETPTPVPPAEPKRSLVKKLAEIMGEVERVPKSGRNEFHRYDYATEADIASAVRAGLAKRAVMIFPSVEKTEWGELPTKSGTMRLCTLTVRFTVEDGDSGEKRAFTVVGEGTDNSDKASYKAMTGAEKYALLKLFLIPTGDDPEKDDVRPPPQRQPPRAPPKADPRDKATPQAGPTPPPPPKPAAPPMQDPELARRASALWEKAKASGWDAKRDGMRWQGFVASVLGTNKKSSTWTHDEMNALEAAWPAQVAAGEPF